MKYWSFDKHEYWALIAAETEEQAVQVYLEQVGHNTVEEIVKEGLPTEITETFAFGKFIMVVSKMPENEGRTLKEFVNEFHSHENETLLITSELA